MANRRVSLWKYTNLPGKGWRYVRAVFYPNGTIKSHVVLVSKQEQTIKDGYYVLGYTGKWEPVGNDPKEAVRLLKCRTHELGARAEGSTIVSPEDDDTTLSSSKLRDAIDAYVQQEYIDRGRHQKTVDAHRVCLLDFAKSCGVKMVADITRSHCLTYVSAYLSKQGNADHTRANKFDRLRGFLKHEKLELLFSKDRPEFAEEEPLALEPDELETFWRFCPHSKRLLFTVLLVSGLRMKELQTLRWIDIDFERGLILIRPRPEYNWTPKKHHCRSVPISDALLSELRTRKLTAKFDLVFHTASGKRLTHLWDDTQAIFSKAGLPMEKGHPHCFRGTFCTTLFREGMDLPSIMAVMGHDPKYPEVTLRYGAALKNDKLRDKMLNVKFTTGVGNLTLVKAAAAAA